MAETETRENARKVREGIVVSDKMDKTAVVETIDRVRHRRYAKTVQRRFFNNNYHTGQIPKIQCING